MPVSVTDGSNGLVYSLRQRFREPLLGLLGISTLVLLVSCINVANLLLARGVKRQRETAVRLALGASRLRLVCQLIVESLILIGGGMGGGILLAYHGVHTLLVQFGRNYSAFELTATPDLRVLLFMSAAAAVSLLLFGVIPAWRSSDVDSAAVMQAASRSVAGSRNRAEQLLVVGQVAFTLALVAGASLFVETLRQLRNVPLGMNTHGVLSVQLMPLPGGYEQGLRRRHTIATWPRGFATCRESRR